MGLRDMLKLWGLPGLCLLVGYHGELKVNLFPQRVQVSLWYILIGYFGGLSIYHSDTWSLWVHNTRII